jgi:hypothetical protein
VTDAKLFTPDQLEDAAINTLGHPSDPVAGILYHLAKLERLRGLRARTLERPKTVSHMANPDAAAQMAGEQLPSVTIMCSGAQGPPERNEEGGLALMVQLAVRINVLGHVKRDTLRRRDWTAFAVVECLLQRMPRHALVSRLDLVDFEPVEHSDDKRIRGEYALIFNVMVPDAISMSVPLLAPPVDPYDPPDDPPVVDSITPGIFKDPLVPNV